MDDKEKNLNNLQNDLNPQNNAGSFPNQNNNGKNLFSKDNLKTMGKNTLKNTGKNLARDARQALFSDGDPDGEGNVMDDIASGVEGTVDKVKGAKNIYDKSKELLNRYRDAMAAKKGAEAGASAAGNAAAGTAGAAGSAAAGTAAAGEAGAASGAAAGGAAAAGEAGAAAGAAGGTAASGTAAGAAGGAAAAGGAPVILIVLAVIIVVILFGLLIIAVQQGDIGYSSFEMEYGVTGDDAHSIFGSDNDYQFGMDYNQVDNVYNQNYNKNSIATCKTGFFAGLAHIFGIYNLEDPCEFSTYIKDITSEAEKKNEIDKISPGLFLSTFYYAFATQMLDENGKYTIPIDASQDETKSLDDFDAITKLFAAKVYTKNDIKNILDNYILMKDKYPYFVYTKHVEENDDGTTREYYTCDRKTLKNVTSDDKFKLMLRYGPRVSEEYEKVISYNEALSLNSSECESEFYSVNGTLSDTNLSKFNIFYDIDETILTEEDNADNIKIRKEKAEKANITINGTTYTYSDGFIYSNFPRYDKRYVDNPAQMDYVVMEEIETFIDSITSRKEYINYILGYPSTVSSTSYSSPANCTYKINGTDITNLKVRLVYAKNDATPNVEVGKPVVGEDLIDFEKYVLGVVHAEIGDGGSESLKVQAILARSIALSVGKIINEGDQNILEITNSTWDQTYCDPDNGCDICMLPGSTVHSVFTKGTTPNSTYCKNWKSGLSSDSKIRTAVRSVNGVTLNDSSGNLYKEPYTISMQNTWKGYENSGSDYVEIIEKYWNGQYSLVNSECSFGAVGEWANWKQYDDAKWGTILMSNIPRPDGTPRTIHKIGCLMTSYAMLIAKSSPTVIIPNFNPGTYTEALKSANALSKYGDMPSPQRAIEIATGLTNVSVHTESIQARESFDSKLARIANYLSQGYDVIIRVKSDESAAIQGGGNSHYVLVTGLNGNEIYIADPGYNINVFSDKYINEGITYLIAIKF